MVQAKRNEHESECLICWEEWSSEDVEQRSVLVLGCCKKFCHSHCLKKWLNEIEVVLKNPRCTDYFWEIEKWKDLDKESLWRRNKACTEQREARQIVESTVETNGYEAWFAVESKC